MSITSIWGTLKALSESLQKEDDEQKRRQLFQDTMDTFKSPEQNSADVTVTPNKNSSDITVQLPEITKKQTLFDKALNLGTTEKTVPKTVDTSAIKSIKELPTFTPKSDKWYAGDQPTTSEAAVQIGKIMQKDAALGQQMWNSLAALQNDNTSMFYDPYTQATNKAIAELTALGFDMTGGVTEKWLADNAWLKEYYRIENGNTPLAPSSKSNKKQDAAYWYYKLLTAEDTTKKAETEWAALQQEIAYWANRTDRNYSDEEILGMIDWGNYKTLVSMDAAKEKGVPTVLNRAVDYSQDALKGVIWAARNKTTGNRLLDSVQALMGNGNKWKEDKDISARLDPTNEKYNPYVLGSTLDDAALYFGVSEFNQDWLKANAYIMGGTDETAKKYYQKVLDAEDFTQKAEAELKALREKIAEKEKTHTPADRIEKDLMADFAKNYPTLAKMDKSLSEMKPLNTTRAIDYKWGDVAEGIEQNWYDYFGDPLAKFGYGATLKKNLGMTNIMHTENDMAIAQEKDKAINDAASVIAEKGTAEEKTVWATANSSNFEGFVSEYYEAIRKGTFDAERDYKCVMDMTDKYAADNYMAALQTSHQYEAQKAAVDNLTKQMEVLQMTLQDMDDSRYRDELAAQYNKFDLQENIAELEAKLYQEQQTLAKMQGEYDEAQKVKANITRGYNTAEVLALINGLDPSTVGSLLPILDYADQISQQSTAPQWSTASVYELALQNTDADYAAVAQAALANKQQYEEAIKTIDYVVDRLKTADVRGVSDTVNILADRKAALLREIQGADYFLLRWNGDFDRVAEMEAAGILDSLDSPDVSREDKQAVDPTIGANDFNPEDGNYSFAQANSWMGSLTEEERKTFLYLRAKQGEDAAMAYYNFMIDEAQARYMGKWSEWVENFAEDKPITSTLLSVLLSPAQLAGTMYTVSEWLKGEDPNPYNPTYMANVAVNTTRETVKQEIKEDLGEGTFGAWLATLGYDAATSAGDSFMNLGLLGGGVQFAAKEGAGALAKFGVRFAGEMLSATPMGLIAAGNTARDVYLRGGNREQAMILSGVNYLAETITEAITIGNIREARALGAGEAAAGKWKTIIKQAIKDGIQEEAPGEAINEIVESQFDTWIMGSMSNWEQKMTVYEQQGMTREEAELQGWKDQIYNALYAAMCGAVSGTGMTAITGTVSRFTTDQGMQMLNGTKQNQTAPQTNEQLAQFTQTITALSTAMKADPASQTAVIAAAMMQNSTDAQSQLLAMTAAQHLVEKYGGAQTAQMLQNALMTAQQNGMTENVTPTLIVAALNDGATSQMLSEAMANNGTVDAGVLQAMAQSAQLEMGDQNTAAQINRANADNMAARNVMEQAANGELNSLAPYQEAVDKASDKANVAQENLERAMADQEAAAQNLNALYEQLEQNPADDQAAAELNRTITSLEGKAKVVQEYTQSLQNAQEALNIAQSNLDKAKAAQLANVRTEAQNAVTEQQQKIEQQRAEEQVQAEAAAQEQQPEQPTANPSESVVYTNDQVPVRVHYDLVNVNDLVTSNMDNFDQNPAFPEELQPRDRTRQANQDQVNQIAKNLNPARLGESADVQNGAPIIGADNVVESGNGRTMAIRQAMNNGTEAAAKYTEWLRQNAEKFGIDPNSVTDNSVLVRVRDTELDRAAFVRAANESTTATYSASEQAARDAALLTNEMMELFSPAENGRLDNADNHSFVLAFMENVIPDSERGTYQQEDGTISQQGMKRMQDAVFQRAYGNTTLTQMFSEETNPGSKNVLNALLQAAPRVVQMQEAVKQGAVYDVNLPAEIADAAARYIQVKNSGQDVSVYLNQTAMPGFTQESAGTQALMKMFDEYKRSSKKIADALRGTMDAIEDAGDPRMQNFLGENVAPQMDEMVRQGVNRANRGQGEGQLSFRRGTNRGNQNQGQNQNATNTKAKRSPYSIAKKLANDIHLGHSLGTRKMNVPQDVLGFYEHRAGYLAVRSHQAGNYQVAMHEIFHALSDRLGMTGTDFMVNNLPTVFRNAYTPAELPGEAFAEFGWHWMRDRADAVAFAGDNFVDQFEQTLRRSQEYRAVTEAQQDLRAYLNGTTNEKLGTVIRDKSDISQRDATVRHMIANIIDDTAAAEPVNQKIREGNNGQVDFNADLRKNSLLKNFSNRVASNILLNDLADSHGTIIGESLATRFENAGLRGNQFDTLTKYMLAKHSEARHARGLPVFDDETITPAERDTFINNVEQNQPEVVRAEQAFQEYRKQMLQAWMVDTGFLTQEAFDRFNAMYPHYVPTYRVMDNANSGRKVGRNGRYQIRRATGGTQDIINPIDSWVDMTHSIVDMVKTNNAALAWDTAYHQYEGLGEFGREITQDIERVSVDTRDLQQRISDLLNGNVTDDILQRALDLIGEEQIEYRGTGRVNMPNVITVRHADGSNAYYEIYNTDLYKLLSSQRETDIGIALRGLSKLTRGMSMLTTGSNPVFALRNFLRDFQNSVNYGSWASNYVTGAAKWVRAAYDVWTKSGEYRDYAAIGGGGWTRIDTGTRKGSEQYRGELIPGYSTRNAGSTLKWVGERAWATLTAEKLNEVVEQTSRYAEYKYGQQDKSTPEGRQQAFLNAQEATVDFARRGNGNFASTLKAIVPFFNASMQGVYRTGRTVTEAERGRAPQRFMKTVLNTAILSALCNALLIRNSDDDEKEAYLNMSDDLKSQHFYLPNFAPDILGNQPLIRIPLAQDPLTYAVHGAVSNAIWSGTSSDPVVELAAIANTILDNLTPVDSTIFDPLIAMGTNINWYGGRIVPTRMLQNRDATTQYTEETPDIFVNIGRAVGMSPLKLQYLAEQYTGYLGQMLVPALSKDKNTGELGGINAALNAARKKLTSDPLVSNDILNSFYDGANILTQVTNAVSDGKPLNMLRRGLTEAEATTAYDEAKKLTSSSGIIGKTKKAINSFYNQIDEINANDSLTDQQKYQLTSDIRKQMIEMVLVAQEAIGAYKEKYITGRNIITDALYPGTIVP